MDKIMILKKNSPAIHKLGNISRPVDDYVHIHTETDTHYIGNFITGYGFIHVKFNKEDCREITPEESEELNNKYVSIGGAVSRYNVDEKGNCIPFEDKYKFSIGEVVMVKRSSGEWTEGKIVDVFQCAVVIEVDHSEWGKGYKTITDNKYDTYIERMKKYNGK